MTTKKEAKKRKRAQRKKNKPKRKSPQKRFLDKVKNSNDLPISHVVVEPEGQAKMSEIILEFAEPLLDQCEGEKSERTATALAIMIWNLSLFPEKDQDREIEKMCSKLLGSNDAKDYAALVDYATFLMERKKKYYSDNKRAIMDYQISGSGKNRRLDVASTLSP